MWKKIILGIVIGVIVLTISAGAIYAFQKNPGDNKGIENKNGYSDSNSGVCSGPKFSSQANYGTQNCANETCNESNCPNPECTGENCINPDCDGNSCNYLLRNQERNCNLEKNGKCLEQMNQEGNCNQYNNNNQYKNQNCEMNEECLGANSQNGENIKNCFGKNK